MELHGVSNCRLCRLEIAIVRVVVCVKLRSGVMVGARPEAFALGCGGRCAGILRELDDIGSCDSVSCCCDWFAFSTILCDWNRLIELILLDLWVLAM
jgi:hypothetical protein